MKQKRGKNDGRKDSCTRQFVNTYMQINNNAP